MPAATEEISPTLRLFNFLTETIGRERALKTVATLAPALHLLEANIAFQEFNEGNMSQDVARAIAQATKLPVERIARLSVANPIAAPEWMPEGLLRTATKAILAEIEKSSWSARDNLHLVLQCRIYTPLLGVGGEKWQTVVPLNVFLNTRFEVAERIASHHTFRILEALKATTTDSEYFLRQNIRELVYDYLALRFIGEDGLAEELEMLVRLLPHAAPLCPVRGRETDWIVITA